MEVKTKAIVLSALKYGDTSLIVKCFTADYGVKSYLLQGILKSKKGKLQPAYFQPLMQLHLTANHKNKGGLERIKEVGVAYPYISAHTDMVKSTVVMFLAEVLQFSLHEEEPNEPLFDYLEAALQWFDYHQDIANFHLCFILHLSKYLGFYPGEIQEGYRYFDLQEGAFVIDPKLNPAITGAALEDFKILLGTDFEGMSMVKLKKTQRNALLNSLIVYFELHLHGFRRPKSLAVLSEVFEV